MVGEGKTALFAKLPVWCRSAFVRGRHKDRGRCGLSSGQSSLSSRRSKASSFPLRAKSNHYACGTNSGRQKVCRSPCLRVARRCRVHAAPAHPALPPSIVIGNQLTVVIVAARNIDDAAQALTAEYEPGLIRVRVPARLGAHWAGSDEVAMESKNAQLQIIVEKDFQCMHKGEDARDPNAYPNPAAAR